MLLLLAVSAFAQQNTPVSPLDALQYGVVLDHPGMKKVVVKPDIPYLKDAKGSLNLDLYLPPGLGAKETRPAIIFLNAIGDAPGQRKVKSWGIYSTWPRLMAAYGYVGISMETDGGRIPESIQGLFDFIAAQGSAYHIDRERLGVYAASANVTRSAEYLMKETAYKGIKAAVLYYGNAPAGPYRKDLPVFFVVAEGDVQRQAYGNLWQEVLKNNAPWTIKMGTGMPHAFDAYSDNDAARKIVKETISFWQNELDPVPAPSWPHSQGRDILGSIHMEREKAIVMLKSLLKEYPDDVNALLFYGDALRDTPNEYGTAETAYKKILSLQPKNSEVLVKLAALCYAHDKTAEAEKYMATAAQSEPVNPYLCFQLGYNLLVANKNAAATVFYEKGLTLEQRCVDYYNLACAYAKMNDKEKAFANLEKALERGCNSKQQYEGDPDLESLKSDRRFAEIIAKTK